MSSDNSGDKYGIRNRRDSFWEGPGSTSEIKSERRKEIEEIKKIKEWDVVEELLRSMHADGDNRYRSPVKSVAKDPPDCEIRDNAGGRVGVEVTEFVDQDVVKMCQQGENVYREWSDEKVREKVAEILKSKDAKAQRWRGLYGKAILVIHIAEEFVLQSPELFPILDASHFPGPKNIDEAYLICSYEPELGYPYRRLNLDGLQPPDDPTIKIE
jgi:hypothetical protein